MTFAPSFAISWIHSAAADPCGVQSAAGGGGVTSRLATVTGSRGDDHFFVNDVLEEFYRLLGLMGGRSSGAR